MSWSKAQPERRVEMTKTENWKFVSEPEKPTKVFTIKVGSRFKSAGASGGNPNRLIVRTQSSNGGETLYTLIDMGTGLPQVGGLASLELLAERMTALGYYFPMEKSVEGGTEWTEVKT